LEVRWDVYTYDVLAWALYKNGRLRDALWAIKEALRAGTQDARLFFHAGVIRRALGEDDTARAYLQRALATNASFDLLHVDGAQRILMELGGRLSPR
jgi:Tfp pilus assembly protein PilF